MWQSEPQRQQFLLQQAYLDQIKMEFQQQQQNQIQVKPEYAQQQIQVKPEYGQQVPSVSNGIQQQESEKYQEFDDNRCSRMQQRTLIMDAAAHSRLVVVIYFYYK